MNAQELKERYASLYDYMASSGNPEYMKVFGKVMNEMTDWFIANKPELAEEWIDKLGAIKWRNYLTQKEASDIVSRMEPKAPWSRETWMGAMDNLSLVHEEIPYYNSCALWAVMNMVYSDSAQSIASIMGKPLQEVPAEQMVKASHALALDKLKDKDGVFNVRKYFGM